ncbi:MAG: cytochrome c-type biogenesis protein CcmH [Candidatus Rokubacteria bacterium]|nr:cytochrome c-type biogenesis protein CcmH [Candidatus Rokubacteria bacterium]
MSWLVAVLVLLIAGPAVAAAPTDREVDQVASQLRCVVCQNLSVADSPSEMARQMRNLVRERLAAGESPEQVKAYFVERYGEWVLLSPPTRGFALIAWGLPLGVLGGGMIVALLVLRRWTARGAAARGPENDDVDPAALAAVRAELAKRRPQ